MPSVDPTRDSLKRLQQFVPMGEPGTCLTCCVSMNGQSIRRIAITARAAAGMSIGVIPKPLWQNWPRLGGLGCRVTGVQGLSDYVKWFYTLRGASWTD